MTLQEVVQLLQAAIEASVYVAPTEPGLTGMQLHEVGKRLGLKDGEIGDAMPRVAQQVFGGRDRRLLLDEHQWHTSGFLVFGEDPDLRDPDAFDSVVSQLNELSREVGAGRARLDRSIMIERAAAQSISRHDMQVAITLMVLSGQLVEENGELRFKSTHLGGGVRPLPSESKDQGARHRMPKRHRTQVMPYVRDVIARRSDGRPQSADPFGAFSEQLTILGYAHFRLWWYQTVHELGQTEPNASPLSALVLAAALVEGALTFVVKHARNQDLGVFGSKDFEKPPTSWKIDDLVEGAARGGDDVLN